jgi:hypothetical protein
VPGIQGISWTGQLTGGFLPVPNLASGIGVSGLSGSGTGVEGASDTGIGVQGFSNGADAIQGTCGSPAHAGVSAYNSGGGYAIWAKAVGEGTDAVLALSASSAHAAVSAQNSNGGIGVWATSDSNNRTPGNVGGVGLYARGATYAAVFDGSGGPAQVQVNGTLHATQDVVLGSDCAEDFDVSRPDEVEPGTVMVLADNGAVEPSQGAYDKKVAGVISGAGDYKPGLILGRGHSSQERMPLALVGKVYCKVDAQYGPIEVGDPLTTSPTPGHAMRAADPLKAFGAVIGKALRSLSSGQGLVPILVALQ